MKTITATFKGRNGSLGYITGKEYKLTLKEFKNGGIWITDQDRKNGTCEYSGVEAFFENWININTEK